MLVGEAGAAGGSGSTLLGAPSSQQSSVWRLYRWGSLCASLGSTTLISPFFRSQVTTPWDVSWLGCSGGIGFCCWLRAGFGSSLLQAAVTANRPVSPNVVSASRRLTLSPPLVPVRPSGTFEPVAIMFQSPPSGLAACSLYATHLAFIIISITIYFYSKIIKWCSSKKQILRPKKRSIWACSKRRRVSASSIARVCGRCADRISCALSRAGRASWSRPSWVEHASRRHQQ